MRRLHPALILLMALAPAAAESQIVLNEMLPNPDGSDTGTERIEIVNAGPTTIDVSGWAIDDAATIDETAVRARIPEDFDTSACPASPIMAPGEFRVIMGQSTAPFLNNSGDDVYLITDRTLNPNVVDLVTYPSAPSGMVWACIPNGSENFAWRTETLCGTNGGVGDFIPPSTVTDLTAAPGEYPGEVRLTWEAPGDDGMSGTASAYEIKVSTAAITEPNFAAATDLEFWINEPIPQAAGTIETLYVFGMDPQTTYFFALEALDDAANTSGVSNSPSSAPLSGTLPDPDLGYSVYFGNLHSHTGYSDGTMTPADAYAYARNTAQTPLDFLAVTDHNHSGAGMSLPNYSLGLAQAAAANDDGNFVAIYGQEWGLSSNGHIILFEAPVLFGWEAGNYDVFVAEGDYASLYTAAIANPPASYAPLALWCHPAPSDFNSLAVTADGLSLVHLSCLVNGPAFSTATDESDIGNTGFDDVYQDALRKGYRVSPTGDQDNHNATWGASSQSRTAVLANSLTKSEVLGALAAGRNYATQDHNAVVEFSADGHAMGESFTATAGVQIVARLTDPDVGESFEMIELWSGLTGTSGATRVAWNELSNEFHWRDRNTYAAGTEMHYYLRIRQGDNQNIWTGAVHVTYGDATSVAQSGAASPLAIRLSPPSPNPTVGPATITFALERPAAWATLEVFDVEGRRVRTLHEGALAAGSHRAEWDARRLGGPHVPSGVYLFRLDVPGTGSVARKFAVIR